MPVPCRQRMLNDNMLKAVIFDIGGVVVGSPLFAINE